jgi:hypothetical protein
VQSDAEARVLYAVGPIFLSEILGLIEQGCAVNTPKILGALIPVLPRLKHDSIFAWEDVFHGCPHSASDVHEPVVM